ncbi:MAG: uroporphyrinogen decarboxylase family protein [Clostridia bacterium]
MQKKQRVTNAFSHRESDIIPYSVDFTILEKEKLDRYFGDPSFEKGIGNHIHCAEWTPEQTEVPGNPGHFRDFFGVVWNKSGPDKDIGVVDTPLIRNPDMGEYAFPRVDYDALDRFYRQQLEENNDKFIISSFGFSLFERAWTLRGMENLLSDMVLEPDFTHALFEAICSFNLNVINFSLEYPFDGIYFGDDWGQQRGLIMGPALWREYIKPYLKRMYAPCKEKGRFIAQHSCGDIHEIFPDVIDIGLDCYNTFQPEIYDIGQIKKEYGRDLSFWGAISTQTLLPFATPEKVRSETARIMEILGKDGGYVAAPTHAVPYDVPCENVEAMLDVFRNQDKYLGVKA